MTYLGMRARTVVAVGLTAVTIGATIGLTLPTSPPCAIVEVCADGSTVTTTYVLSTGEVVEVDHHDGHLADVEAAEVADRLATIRDERAGERFAR